VCSSDLLVEWDIDIPALDVLVAEANKANVLYQRVKEEFDACTA
jgi:uncharacterized protein (UPF0276 family)